MDTEIVGAKASKGTYTGKAQVIRNVADLDKFVEGNVLVTRMTDPDFVPMMKMAGAIVTEIGGRLCHAAIVARELGVPAVVKVDGAMDLLNGKQVTVDGDTGKVVVHG
jgi:pyruvate,water dikinase